jgi:RNA polymerase sigma-70 factor (ECF subfamily)
MSDHTREIGETASVDPPGPPADDADHTDHTDHADRTSPQRRDETMSAGVGGPRMRRPSSTTSAGNSADRTTGEEARPGIEDIIRDHSAAMYRVAVSVVHDHALAEDVVQESVVKAWQALDTFRGEASIRTWLLRITHNTAISALRKRRDDVTAPSELPERPGRLSVEESALLQADRDEIWAALSRLDPVGRTIVVLREVDRMSYEEIAEVLDLPTATVRTRLFRARQQLVRTSSAREAFASRGIAEPDRIREGGAA